MKSQGIKFIMKAGVEKIAPSGKQIQHTDQDKPLTATQSPTLLGQEPFTSRVKTLCPPISSSWVPVSRQQRSF